MEINIIHMGGVLSNYQKEEILKNLLMKFFFLFSDFLIKTAYLLFTL